MKAFSDTLWQPGQVLDNSRQSLTPAEMSERLLYLEKLIAKPDIDNIPLADLQRKMSQIWQPDPATLLPNGGITTDLMSPVPSARVYASAALGLVNNVVTTIPFDSEVWDDFFMHEAAINPSRMTAKVRGVYGITANPNWATAAAGERYTDLVLSGALIIGMSRIAPDAVSPTATAIATQMRLDVGDYIELRMYQSSGGVLNTVGGLSGVHLEMTWMGNY